MHGCDLQQNFCGTLLVALSSLGSATLTKCHASTSSRPYTSEACLHSQHMHTSSRAAPATLQPSNHTHQTHRGTQLGNRVELRWSWLLHPAESSTAAMFLTQTPHCNSRARSCVLSDKKTSRVQPWSRIQTKIKSREVTKPTRIMNQDMKYKDKIPSRIGITNNSQVDWVLKRRKFWQKSRY